MDVYEPETMTRNARAVAVVLALAFAVAAVLSGVWLWIARAHGFSAREKPRLLERMLARTARRWAVPANERDAVNPVAFSAEVFVESRAHFADHCATCHANDGGGRTEMGRNLYPRAPDMRLPDTQTLTDGELYWIIENGIRLTGMPAWGSGRADDADTWKLVHFIRHLKDLTPADLKAMQALNPKSPDELKEEQDDERFLAGETPEASSPNPHHHN
jgi:mono/diheme cytochrome c family protein